MTTPHDNPVAFLKESPNGELMKQVSRKAFTLILAQRT